jgi:eukaryotic-like serine/threonine-protein kinase
MGLTGRTIGKYRITGELGRGGMATVYEALDERLQRTVAIKVLDRDAPSSAAEAIRRFETEARIVAAFNHPNIVPVFDFGLQDNLIYIVSPVVRGELLSARIKRGPMSVGEAGPILSQVAAALDYAHSHGVIHRDVKPGNIIIDANGRAHLMDFGIAKSRGGNMSNTRAGTAVGTIRYMAPEAVRGESIDYRVDIYSLGLVAFEVLAGKPAFDGNSEFSILTDIVNGNSLRLSSENPNLPRELTTAVHRAFSPNSASRFASAAEFVETAFHHYESTSIRPAPLGVRLRPLRVPIALALVEIFAIVAVVVNFSPDGLTGTSESLFAAGLVAIALIPFVAAVLSRSRRKLRSSAPRAVSIKQSMSGSSSEPVASPSTAPGDYTRMMAGLPLRQNLPPPALSQPPRSAPTASAYGESTATFRVPAPPPPATSLPVGDFTRMFGVLQETSPVISRTPPPVSIYKEFELLELLVDGECKTYAARKVSNNERVEVHVFYQIRSPESEDLVRRLAGGDCDYPEYFMQAGLHEDIPYIATRPTVGHEDVREWFRACARKDKPAESLTHPREAVLPSPPIQASEPGEFTKAFQVTPVVPSAPPPTPPPSPTQTSAPGEFTRMFQTRPSAPEPPSTASGNSAIASGPGESTAIFPIRPNGPSGAAAPIVATPEPPDVVLRIVSCRDSAAVNTRVPVDRFPFKIGRSGADFNLLFDPAVSAPHVELDYQDGGFAVRDLSSANGTYLNGRRLQPDLWYALRFGSKIDIGSDTQLAFGPGDELPDLSGREIARYVLTRELHSGATSVVYAAHDKQFEQRSVALKILFPRLANHPGYREQFTNEAQAAVRLRHPNICSVYEYGEIELPTGARSRTLYVCMQFLEGESLSRRVDRKESCTIEQVGTWLERLCDALAYAHRRNVFHGGVKPSAVVFDVDGNPYLTDFAIVTTPDAGEDRTLLGSPLFLAPEQLDNGETTAASDQYSLAVLTYLLVTGELPYVGQQDPHVRRRNFLRGAEPAHEMAAKNGRPSVPARVSTILSKALSLRPEDRYAAVTEFGTEFRNALTAVEPIPSRPPSVFISYQRVPSAAWALLIRDRIKQRCGFDVFVDSIRRDTAGKFPARLERQIGRCDVFVCILAETTLESAWVKREVELAYLGKKPMIPVFQETYSDPPDLTTLEPHLQELITYEGVKLLDQQNLYADAALDDLISRIKQYIGPDRSKDQPE